MRRSNEHPTAPGCSGSLSMYLCAIANRLSTEFQIPLGARPLLRCNVPAYP